MITLLAEITPLIPLAAALVGKFGPQEPEKNPFGDEYVTVSPSIPPMKTASTGPGLLLVTIGVVSTLLGYFLYQHRKGLWEQELKVTKDIHDRLPRVCKEYVEPGIRDQFAKDPLLRLLLKLLYQAESSLSSPSLAQFFGNTSWDISQLSSEIDRLIRNRCKGYVPVTQPEFEGARKLVNKGTRLQYEADPQDAPVYANKPMSTPNVTPIFAFDWATSTTTDVVVTEAASTVVPETAFAASGVSILGILVAPIATPYFIWKNRSSFSSENLGPSS